MALFQGIVDTLPTTASTTLGSTVRITMPRDYAREGFLLRVNVTVSGVAATIAPEGIFALVKKIRLSVNDGGQNRDLVNADALSIVQRHIGYGGNLDTTTLATFSNAFGSATAKVFTIPFFFAPLNIEDPTRSLFLANFPRFNNDPILEITVGSQADVDTNATPTFAVSSLTFTVVDYKRFVSSDNWTFLKTDFITYQQSYTQNAANQRYNIPVPGWHFAIFGRMYTSATALGDITQTNGLIRIQALNVVERVLQLADLRTLNENDINSDVLTTTAGQQRLIAAGGGGSFVFHYTSDILGFGVTNLDTLLNSNPYVQLGTAPQVVADINGGSNKQIIYGHDRCYGDISSALIAPRLKSK